MLSAQLNTWMAKRSTGAFALKMSMGNRFSEALPAQREKRDRYLNAVLRCCASNTVIDVPCEHDGGTEVESSWE